MVTVANSTKPKHQPDEQVHTAEFVATLPPYYALTTVGKCMEPLIPDGSNLVFTSEFKPEPTDIVCIWWRPGKNAPGSYQAQVKQLLIAPPKRLTLPFDPHPQSEVHETFVYRALNPGRSLRARCHDVLAIHKCLGFRKPDGSLLTFADSEGAMS